MPTTSIPLQNIVPQTSIDTYVDHYMNIVDSRHSIHSFTSDSTNSKHSQESNLSEGDINMIRKTYYEHGDENDDSQTLRSGFKEECDEENERLVPDNDELSDEVDNGRSTTKVYGRAWLCFLFLGVLLIGWLAWIVVVNSLSPDGPQRLLNHGNHIDLADISKAEFMPKRPLLTWVENRQTDGVFTFKHPDNHNIMVGSVEEKSKQVLLDSADLMINHGLLSTTRYSFSSDNIYMMLWTNETSVWRYSSLATIYVYNRDDKSVFPLVNTSTFEKPPSISYAVWSPVGHQVAYVMNNNIFITDLHSHKQITFDGSSTVFNGIPDWVYEEEVLLQNFALWWSPDASHLAYLRLDETMVPELHLPIYTTENDSYPEEISIKYPKAGAPNPIVSLLVYSIDQSMTILATKNATSVPSVTAVDGHRDFDDDDRIITDVHWATDSHTHLLFKQSNRVQDRQLTNLLSFVDNSHNDNGMTEEKQTGSLHTVDDYSPKDGGWIDAGKTMSFFGQYRNKDGTWSVDYIDVLSNEKGFMHLTMVTVSRNEFNRRWLTDGDWEVELDSVVVDRKRELVHFISTERSPLERHLYTISLSDDDPSSSKKCLTCPADIDKHAYYRAKFSPLAGYYILYYDGPDIPTTVVKKVDDPSFELPLQKNDALRQLLARYELPRKRLLNIKSGTTDMNAIELLPPDFDPRQKYPVLFHVYGGPGSQLVTYEFQIDWHTFLASKLQYVVVTVDARGTGFRGRGYRVGVRKRLGELETIDHTNAARHWAGLDYVDNSRISIWGWSYGGFLASKCVELNSGLFSSAMAVAPVTDWRYYDSIYTERYMMTPKMNHDGYVSSAVNNMTGFANTKFLLVHGTADDNVHFQNTATLVDKLTRASIHSYKVQFYTDSNHLIDHHNANANLYHLLTEFLWESFGGEEYLHLRKETFGKFSGKVEGEGNGGHSHGGGNGNDGGHFQNSSLERSNIVRRLSSSPSGS